MSKDVQCPYCHEWNEICHDGGYGYTEDDTFNQECRSCGKSFAFSTSIVFYYEVYKAPCLNEEEGEHFFYPYSRWTGSEYEQHQICSLCGYDEQIL